MTDRKAENTIWKAIRLPMCFLLSMIAFFFQNTRIEVIAIDTSEAGSWFAALLAKLQYAGIGINSSISIVTLLFALALYRLFLNGKWRFSASALLVSLLFGAMQTCGLSVHTMGSLLYLNANGFQWFLGLSRMASSAFIMYVALMWLFAAFDRQNQLGTNAPAVHSQNTLLHWMDKHVMLCCFVLMLLCWAPYYISFYPGGFLIDSYMQLNSVFGLITPNSKNPIYHSYLVSFFVWLGRTVLKSDNVGLYLFTLFQIVASAAIYASALSLIRKMKISKWFFWGSLVFFALTPVLVTYTVAELKDPLFAAFTVLFVTQTIRFLQLPTDKYSVKGCTIYALSALPFGLCRNGSLYLLLPVVICWGVIGLKHFRSRTTGRAITPFLPCMGLSVALCCLFILTKTMLPVLGVLPGTRGDMLSLPFQQTARYVSTYPNSITEEEEQAISAVMDYDNLRTLYDPELSDPVIASYRQHLQSTEGEAMMNYLAVWLKMGMKHPMTYIEATVANSYPFYTFFTKYEKGGINYLYIDPTVINDEHYSFVMPEALAPARDLVRSVAQLFGSIPLANAANDAAAYAWLLLGMVAYLLHKRAYRKLMAAAIPLMIFVACIASPVAHLRYFLPVVASAPLLLALCCHRMDSTSDDAVL